MEEENKKLKHKLEQMYNDTKDTYNEICAEQIDYKSRNEKAIEHIKENLKNSISVDAGMKLEKVKNILEGSDK